MTPLKRLWSKSFVLQVYFVLVFWVYEHDLFFWDANRVTSTTVLCRRCQRRSHHPQRSRERVAFIQRQPHDHPQSGNMICSQRSFKSSGNSARSLPRSCQTTQSCSIFRGWLKNALRAPDVMPLRGPARPPRVRPREPLLFPWPIF